MQRKWLNAFSSFATESPNIPTLSQVDTTGGDLNLISGMISQLKMQDDRNYEHNIPFSSNTYSNPALADVLVHRPDSGTIFFNHVEQRKQYQMEFLSLMAKSDLPRQYEMNVAGIRNHVRPSSLPSSNPCNAFYSDNIRSAEEESQFFQVSAQNLRGTNNAIVNFLTKLQEEARDHAHIRNAYFEQARQAYFVGDKTLARDAGAKGQLYNRLMKAAQNKAAELIFEQRNMSSAWVSRIDPEQTQLLDLEC